MKHISPEKALFAFGYKSFGRLIERIRQHRALICPWLEQCNSVECGQDWFIFRFPEDQQFARKCLVDDHIDTLRSMLSEIVGHNVTIVLK